MSPKDTEFPVNEPRHDKKLLGDRSINRYYWKQQTARTRPYFLLATPFRVSRSAAMKSTVRGAPGPAGYAPNLDCGRRTRRDATQVGDVATTRVDEYTVGAESNGVW